MWRKANRSGNKPPQRDMIQTVFWLSCFFSLLLFLWTSYVWLEKHHTNWACFLLTWLTCGTQQGFLPLEITVLFEGSTGHSYFSHDCEHITSEFLRGHNKHLAWQQRMCSQWCHHLHAFLACERKPLFSSHWHHYFAKLEFGFFWKTLTSYRTNSLIPY